MKIMYMGYRIVISGTEAPGGWFWGATITWPEGGFNNHEKLAPPAGSYFPTKGQAERAGLHAAQSWADDHRMRPEES